MKKTLLFIAILTFSLNANAQYVNVWKDGKLTFETKQKIDTERDEDETDYDGENDVLGINMQIVTINQNVDKNSNTLKLVSREGCKNMYMDIIEDGRPFLPNYMSHYTVCRDGEDYVLNAVIYREDNKKAYDINLYCYDISVKQGVKILESFKFLD